jgi:hypothetical protein
MITKEMFDSLTSDSITRKNYNRIIVLIDKRVDEIADVFLKPGYRWYYGNPSRIYDGFFDPVDFAENIVLVGQVRPVYGRSSSFPTRWLWEESFAEEIAANIEKYKQSLLIKRAQREKKNLRKAELKASIQSKLTKEELKAIKFK